MAGLAVGKGPKSFHLRIVRGPQGRLVSLERSSFNQGKKDLVESAHRSRMESLFTFKQRRATQRKRLSGKAVRGDKVEGWRWRGCQKAMLGRESSKA